ncbi:MAG: protein kinase [Pseudonocardiales bacterium]|nr:protein kinase [Pseudonocardiales bacterium]
MNPDTRFVADRYRLDRRIGTGAMGVVWCAHDARLNRTVAIKELLMQPGLAEADAQTARDRAMREGRIAARLQHPHAIHVYDVALDGATGASGQVVPWLVMEYLPSRSLAAVLAERGTLAPHEAARIGQQVAAALAAAHEAGIVHRDVKPGNVLLGQDGIVKITDFGISRASWDTTVTRTGVLAGTPAYFAPEVARGERPGPASDVFSLGSTLYAAVEGEPPFGLDDNTLALLRTVTEGRVRPPQRAGPLSAVLMQLLADDPAARPSMPEAITALGAVAAHRALPPVAPPMATPRVAKPPLVQPPMARPLHTRTTVPALATPTAVDLSASAAPAVTARRSPAADRIPWWRRPAVLFGAASCLLVLTVVLAIASTMAVPTAGRGQLAVATSTTPPAPGAHALPAPVQVLPAQPQPVPPQPAQLEQTVRTYYGLLPDDTTVAWQYLGAAERAQGFQQYNDFWSEINRISIRGPVAVQGSTVLVNLVFEPTNRKRTLERYRLTMGNAPDGRVLIESAARIGGSALATAKPNVR